MENKLDRIEAYLRAIFEDSLFKIHSGKESQLSLVDELIRAMRENLSESLKGDILAPDHYIFHVSSADFHRWQSHIDILNELADSIFLAGHREGLRFQSDPKIVLHNNPDLKTKSIFISAHISPKKPILPVTAAMAKHPQQDIIRTVIPDEAFLVVGGTTNFPLNKPTINIGRHSNNDLVLDDLHISRHHAQLRAINKQYVIFDVGSTGGIYINGKKIIQATLQSGDVLRLGLVNLIFVQDTTAAHPTTAIEIDNEHDLPGEKST